MGIRRKLSAGAAVAALAVTAMLAPSGASAESRGGSEPSLFASGLEGTSGSTIGPDGALYVTEAVLGQVTRIDPRTGAESVFATGLPRKVIGLGGATDVAFVGGTAYVLVTLVSADVTGTPTENVSGIYRIDDLDSHTVVADIGAWSIANPPPPDFEIFIASGLQFAMEPVRGGFLVTDGHHNRVVKATMSGEVSLVKQFGNIVPTGLATLGPLVLLAEAGPVPHEPSTGKVVAFGTWGSATRQIASGYSLLVDVELARCGLFALSQGDSPGIVDAGSPALPDSGELLKVGLNGSFSVVADELDLPTSVAFAGDTAFVTTNNGEVWKIDDVPCFGWR